MKNKSLEAAIKASGETFFRQHTNHLSTQAPSVAKSRSWLSIFTWMVPSGGVVTGVVILVAILIGATDPNGSIFQPFTAIEALNQVQYPTQAQRLSLRETYLRQPETIAYQQRVNAFFQQTATALFQTDESLVYSPFSAYMGLSLLLEAASGDTELVLKNILGVNDIDQHAESSLHALIETYLEVKETIEGQSTVLARSLMANGVFIRDDVSVSSDYLFRLSEQYLTEVYHTAFDASGLADISRWLNQKTFNFLDMKPEDLSINQETVMSLFNTFYLKANWLESFFVLPEKNTFTNRTTNESIEGVTFMKKDGMMDTYVNTPDYTLAIDQAYGDLRVAYVLPKGGRQPVALMQQSIWPSLQMHLGHSNTETRVTLMMPKTSTKGKLDLKDALIQVFPESDVMFDSQRADLSKALPNAYIQNLIQHTKIDFTEDGFEAAAITEANVGVTSLPLPPEIQLILNESYLYLILNSQGMILFAGVMNQPST